MKGSCYITTAIKAQGPFAHNKYIVTFFLIHNLKKNKTHQIWSDKAVVKYAHERGGELA